jgi:hypothetical protein
MFDDELALIYFDVKIVVYEYLVDKFMRILDVMVLK